jgi:hypothetical protein
MGKSGARNRGRTPRRMERNTSDLKCIDLLTAPSQDDFKPTNHPLDLVIECNFSVAA